ncbi:hypothetical protein CERZMDRAFT_92929 [Cercospora zeae-maydis SCOH1-5]|uniref:DUF4185 domain-containing protein n=1 Tax=Cercospora zeae-maydis SCOH1-5 TaxID=717836 RepID=A0A6A6FTN6_9PEZI|nr:hypothetical protein CERZMDRAFT_92929 [Cercospora zeae-maydis SCOH1-5]
MTTTVPRMKTATYLANVTDPALTRDSCASSRIGDRVLWTCRDTQGYDAQSGKPITLPIMTNSAAWTNLSASGGPLLAPGPVGAGSNGSNPILHMYGGHPLTMPMYYPLQDTQCPDSGACEDGTRYVVWPDQPPLITQRGSDGSTVGYTWIPNQQLRGINNGITTNPLYHLYKEIYAPSADPNALPKVGIISTSFYGDNAIGYGRYGSLVHEDVAYLYGQTAERETVLARVSPDRVEDRTAYEYFQASTRTWTNSSPVFNVSTITSSPTNTSNSTNSTIAEAKTLQSTYVLPNAGLGGQGTFYYSSYFSRFIWIGQSLGLDGGSATFYITASPSPEGPWAEPQTLFAGQNGDHDIVGGYTLQAHPALLPSGPHVASEKGIYLSWTQQWRESTVGSGYITPLVYLEFE